MTQLKANRANRVENYLNNYTFYTNSVDFRIVSSKALEKWKNIQAFQLNQLVNGNHYFEKSVREVLLLKYDLWSKFIYEVENFCIEIYKSKNDPLNSFDVDTIETLLNATIDKRVQIIADNQTAFNHEFIEIWEKQHSTQIDFMKERVFELEGIPVKSAFVKLVDIISDMLVHALYEIFEIQTLMCSIKNDKLPFIIISQNCKRASDVQRIIKRVEIYKESIDFTTVYLKNFSETNISEAIVNGLTDAGIHIDFARSDAVHHNEQRDRRSGRRLNDKQESA